jgi:hypothetical protein
VNIHSLVAQGLPRLVSVFKAFKRDDGFFSRFLVAPETGLGGFGLYFGNAPGKVGVFKDAPKFR